MREGLLDKSNLSSSIWADSAYRSRANERYLERNDFNSRIHCKKPKGRPMSERMERANAKKSAVRAKVEHVFTHQKDRRMDLFTRTVGLARAEAKIGMVNLVYNMKRLFWRERRKPAPAWRMGGGKAFPQRHRKARYHQKSSRNRTAKAPVTPPNQQNYRSSRCQNA